MEDSNSKRERLKAIVLLLIGFIIGFAAHAFTSNEAPVVLEEDAEVAAETETMTSEDGESTSEEDATTEESTFVEPVEAQANNASASGYSVSVNDQEAGNTVHVSQATLEEAAWIAIREDINGGLGNILGAAWYPAGQHTVSVELLRGTEKNTLYYAVVYSDDGDKVFDFNKDTLVTDADDKVLVAKFRAY